MPSDKATNVTLHLPLSDVHHLRAHLATLQRQVDFLLARIHDRDIRGEGICLSPAELQLLQYRIRNGARLVGDINYLTAIIEGTTDPTPATELTDTDLLP